MKTYEEALKELSIDITKEQLNQLHRYYELLIEYNKVMNLTGIIEEKEVYLKHFYDSITLARVYSFQKDEKVCDIGTGAGFPGMVLKIVFPFLQVTLVDSLQKRIDFLNVVIEELELTNIEAIHDRIEDYAKGNREMFDVVTARAVSQLPILLEYAIPLLKVNGSFLSMKGLVQESELHTHAFDILKCNMIKMDQFLLPKENSNRTIYVIQKKAKTNLKYPRKYSMIKNKPL